ncbi:MAG: aspartate aminotransferase family protein, partial [Methylococcaceae bacterium]
MTVSLMPTYARMPVSFERGQGPWLWTTEGQRYLDAISGIAVCNLGHAHPKIAEALCDQARTLIHTSNLYGIALQEQLAERLAALSGLDNVFFSNSGAEANEAALKLARKYGHSRGISHPKVIVMENSFHGRTLFTLSATGSRKVQEGFEPLVEGFIRAPFGDGDQIEALDDPDIVAIFLEPIQGEGGIRVAPNEYLTRLRTLCDQRHWLLMFDEVQCGMGRSGRWFGFQHANIKPDVMTLAKALGNGFPIGACLARGAAAEVLTQGNHGSTFGGNPLACRAALSVIDILSDEHLVQRAASLGETIRSAFEAAFKNNPKVREVR